MAFLASVVKVMIASPGDVVEERRNRSGSNRVLERGSWRREEVDCVAGWSGHAL